MIKLSARLSCLFTIDLKRNRTKLYRNCKTVFFSGRVKASTFGMHAIKFNDVCYISLQARLTEDLKEIRRFNNIHKCCEKLVWKLRKLSQSLLKKYLLSVIVQLIVCWLIRRETSVQNPCQTSPSKRNMEKYIFDDYRRK